MKMLKTSSVALLVGLLVSAIGIKQTSLATFMISTALLGIGYGTGFQGSIRSVAALLAQEARAGVLSILFIVSYFSMGVPVILAGYRLTATGNVQHTAEELGIAALVLAIAALLAELRGHGQRSSGE
ncbi:hypothetical protein [Paraburkholderia sp. D1E]|uniref:hypothetical protein n=1 Tax=Paraburkholderia sp. D1E TaxID=3461398 RepID=UPI0040458E54